MLTHTPRTLLGRQGVLTIDRPRGGFYFYDSATALLSRLDDRLGRSLAGDTEEAPTELYLDAAGALTALEERTHPGHLASAVAVDGMNTLALGVEAGCNLACTYCYNDNHYDRPQFRPAVTGMTLDTALTAIEHALADVPAGERLTVQLIGGEPLLQFPMIRELVPRAEALGRARGCEVRFGMNTNGLGLTAEITDYLIEHRIGVAISIDGTQRQHDRQRTFSNGRGSYEALAARIGPFLERYREVSPIRTARITAGDPDFDFVEAVEHVTGMGFNNIGIGLALSAMLGRAGGAEHAPDTDPPAGGIPLPVVTPPGHTKRAVIDRLVAGLTALKTYCLDQYRARNLFRVSLFNDTMFTLYAFRPKYTPCGAQRRYAGVSPNGEVVPCHRYLGTKDTSRIFGSVRDEAVNRLSPQERDRHVGGMKFLTVLEDTRDDAYSCRTCWARHLCGGECYEVRDTLGANFATDKPFMCDLKRALYQMGVELLIALQDDQPLLKELMQMNALLKPSEVAAAARASR